MSKVFTYLLIQILAAKYYAVHPHIFPGIWDAEGMKCLTGYFNMYCNWVIYVKITFANLGPYLRRIKDKATGSETTESEDSQEYCAAKKVCPEKVMRAACKIQQYPLQCQLYKFFNF